MPEIVTREGPTNSLGLWPASDAASLVNIAMIPVKGERPIIQTNLFEYNELLTGCIEARKSTLFDVNRIGSGFKVRGQVGLGREPLVTKQGFVGTSNESRSAFPA
jgi:hypothetical protein